MVVALKALVHDSFHRKGDAQRKHCGPAARAASSACARASKDGTAVCCCVDAGPPATVCRQSASKEDGARLSSVITRCLPPVAAARRSTCKFDFLAQRCELFSRCLNLLILECNLPQRTHRRYAVACAPAMQSSNELSKMKAFTTHWLTVFRSLLVTQREDKEPSERLAQHAATQI